MSDNYIGHSGDPRVQSTPRGRTSSVSMTLVRALQRRNWPHSCATSPARCERGLDRRRAVQRPSRKATLRPPSKQTGRPGGTRPMGEDGRPRSLGHPSSNRSADRLAGRSSRMIQSALSSMASASASRSPSPKRRRDNDACGRTFGACIRSHVGRTGIEGTISRATAGGIRTASKMAGRRSSR